MFGKFLPVSAVALAAITLPQSCSQVDLGNFNDAASTFTLVSGDAFGDAFGFKSGLRAEEAGPPPPPPPPPPVPSNPPDPGGGSHDPD